MAEITERDRQKADNIISLFDGKQMITVHAAIVKALSEAREEGRAEGRREMKENAAKCADNEPEYPDEPPEEMVAFLKKADVEALVESHRITVRLTKRNIADAIRKLS